MNWSAIKDLLLAGGGVTGAVDKPAGQIKSGLASMDLTGLELQRKDAKKAYLVTGKDSTMVSNPHIRSDNYMLKM